MAKAKKTKTKKKAVAKKTAKKKTRTAKKTRIIPYGIDDRAIFVSKVIELRKTPLTYGGVALAMNAQGFRNRNGDDITPQFVGNILNRFGN